MHARLLEPIDFDGRTFPAGIHEMSDAEFHALRQRGPVRPATLDEVEQASAKPAVETASRSRGKGLNAERLKV